MKMKKRIILAFIITMTILSINVSMAFETEQGTMKSYGYPQGGVNLEFTGPTNGVPAGDRYPRDWTVTCIIADPSVKTDIFHRHYFLLRYQEIDENGAALIKATDMWKREVTGRAQSVVIPRYDYPTRIRIDCYVYNQPALGMGSRDQIGYLYTILEVVSPKESIPTMPPAVTQTPQTGGNKAQTSRSGTPGYVPGGLW